MITTPPTRSFYSDLRWLTRPFITPASGWRNLLISFPEMPLLKICLKFCPRGNVPWNLCSVWTGKGELHWERRVTSFRFRRGRLVYKSFSMKKTLRTRRRYGLRLSVFLCFSWHQHFRLPFLRTRVNWFFFLPVNFDSASSSLWTLRIAAYTSPTFLFYANILGSWCGNALMGWKTFPPPRERPRRNVHLLKKFIYWKGLFTRKDYLLEMNIY